MAVTDDLLTLTPEQRREWWLGETDFHRRQVFAAFNRSHGTPYAFWRDDPVGFVRDALGDFLWSGQNQILTDVRDYPRVAVPAAAGPGKALRDGTPVLTPTGWVPIEQLTPGDMVVAGDGTPTEVLGVYPQGIQPLYRVHVDDGGWVDTTGEHLWGVSRGHATEIVTTVDLTADASGDYRIPQYAGQGTRPVVAVIPTSPGPATCIRVAHTSGLFVTKDLIVTHNTYTAGRLVVWWVCVNPPGEAQVITTAPGFRQVRGLLWPHIRGLVEKHQLPGHETCNQVEWQIGSHIAALGFAPSKNDEASGQGYHARRLLVLVDEAGGIPQKIGENLDALLTSEGSRILAIGNPPIDEQGTWFEKICGSQDWHVRRIGALDTPNFTGEEVPDVVAKNIVTRQWVADMTKIHGGDGSNWIQAKVHAQFPTGSMSKTIPRDWIDRVVGEKPDEDWATNDWQRLGVDIASDGGDEMVIAHLDGTVAKIVHTSVASDNADQFVVAERILEWIQHCEAIQATRGYTQKKVRVKVDVIGVGRGAYDLLVRWGREGVHGEASAAHGADVVAVNFSERANDPVDFQNRRAEAWWAMRETIREQGVWLAVSEKEVVQLNGPSWGNSANGRKQIESKRKVAERIGGSPDRADAIILAVYEPVVVVETVTYAPPPTRRSVPSRPASRY